MYPFHPELNALIEPLFLEAGLSTELLPYYVQVKKMLRDSVYIRVTLDADTPYMSTEDIRFALSSRVLYS
jgi:hypothetical protein